VRIFKEGHHVTTKRILVVDNEPDELESYTGILEGQGFEVHGTTSGAQAIALYKREDFDLSLLGLKIPDMDGLKVLAALKEYDSSAAVIIFTAHGTKETVVEALRLGACEFIEKPANTETLIATVHRVLARGNGAVVRGKLRSMSLPSIVQINCTERNQARLRIKRQGQEGSIFFADGEVVHAVLDSRVGEEVVYELLTWENGDFELEMGVSPPEQTIATSWSGLLLEGMRQVDEQTAGLEELDAPQRQQQHKEIGKMATRKRSEVLDEILSTLLSTSADIDGAIVVSNEGLVMASNLPRGADATRFGASAAALLGLSKRTTPTLGRGDFTQGLVQGANGNVIIVGAGDRAVFVGLTPKDANLGMVFLEARDTADAVADAL
jgi:hypothetical protein